MSDTGSKSPGTSNGTSTDSTNNSPPATEPGGTTRSAKARRSGMARINSRCDALERQAAESKDQTVIADLSNLREARTAFAKAMGERPATTAGLPKIANARTELRRLLEFEIRTLQKGLQTVPGGPSFVNQTRGPNPQTTARNIRSQITPKVLGHNQPLYEAMLTALENFERLDGEYNAQHGAAAEASAKMKYAHRMLELSIQALDHSIKHAVVEAERAQLKPAAKRVGRGGRAARLHVA